MLFRKWPPKWKIKFIHFDPCQAPQSICKICIYRKIFTNNYFLLVLTAIFTSSIIKNNLSQKLIGEIWNIIFYFIAFVSREVFYKAKYKKKISFNEMTCLFFTLYKLYDHLAIVCINQILEDQSF